MKILIAGGGNMGKTYADSFIANHAVDKNDLFLLEKQDDKIELFSKMGFKNVYTTTGPWVWDIDLIILAVKPQDAPNLYPLLSPYLSNQHLILSIMAGITISSIQAGLPVKKVVRAMPNLPAQIGMGMTGFTADASVGKIELFGIQNLLNTTGKSIYFEEEEKLDAVTAISGSGPAYVFYFMESMINSAIEMGFRQTEAEVLVAQTFMGAIHLHSLNRLSCSEWIAKVASKGGTTEAAIRNFNETGLAEKINQGLKKALARATELGQ